MSGYLLALALEPAADVTQRRSAKSLRVLYMHESCRARLWHLQTALAQHSTCWPTECGDLVQELTFYQSHSQLERVPGPQTDPGSCMHDSDKHSLRRQHK